MHHDSRLSVPVPAAIHPSPLSVPPANHSAAAGLPSWLHVRTFPGLQHFLLTMQLHKYLHDANFQRQSTFGLNRHIHRAITIVCCFNCIICSLQVCGWSYGGQGCSPSTARRTNHRACHCCQMRQLGSPDPTTHFSRGVCSE